MALMHKLLHLPASIVVPPELLQTLQELHNALVEVCLLGQYCIMC